ncbi:MULTISPECIES: hypothetical protein [unclassified Streptomyces]|uniref:hypothetical protein n=1 Tax=unclassified Streptomyces TaxID=2593676 RepID=UPI003812DD5D
MSASEGTAAVVVEPLGGASPEASDPLDHADPLRAGEAAVQLIGDVHTRSVHSDLPNPFAEAQR